MPCYLVYAFLGFSYLTDDRLTIRRLIPPICSFIVVLLASINVPLNISYPQGHFRQQGDCVFFIPPFKNK